jgi:hypothetical protein
VYSRCTSSSKSLHQIHLEGNAVDGRENGQRSAGRAVPMPFILRLRQPPLGASSRFSTLCDMQRSRIGLAQCDCGAVDGAVSAVRTVMRNAAEQAPFPLRGPPARTSVPIRCVVLVYIPSTSYTTDRAQHHLELRPTSLQSHQK